MHILIAMFSQKLRKKLTISTNTHTPLRENPPLDYFSFEVDLLESPTAPKVEAGKIVVNNLTHNVMKLRYFMYD